MCVLSKLEGKFQIMHPYFLEYERVLENRLIKRDNIDDFTDDYHIIIVNPNNPDGKLLDINIVQKLLDKLKDKNKFLIYDESFADFCFEKDISLKVKY